MASRSSPNLLAIVSNHLVLSQLAPYLSISALFKLSVTSRKFKEIIENDPSAFRRLDFSTVRGVPTESCEVEPAEEHLIWKQNDDKWKKYCLPLTKVSNILWKRNILPTVQTLILDRQYVHVEEIRNILVNNTYQIRLLSLLDVNGLDRVDFQNLIEDIFRGGRGSNSPCLEGIYYFGPPPVSHKFRDQLTEDDAVSPDSATGAEDLDFYNQVDSPNPWYLRSRVAFFQPPEFESLYSPLLRATQGALVWDAVLCRASRHTYPHPKFTVSPIASVALGPKGCHICHSAPEGPGSTTNQLPLLSPLPFHSSSVKVAQSITSNGAPIASLPFYARCVYCLKHRWCAMCNKWWCENCYQFGGPNCYKENDAKEHDSAGSKVCAFLLPSTN
jgi:hypothetical protein